MHVLVTGGAGYLGSTLVPLLLESGHQVSVFDRFYFGRQSLQDSLDRHSDRLRLRRGDVRNIEPSDFEGVEGVVDLAGISNDPSCELDPELTKQVNRDAAARVARAAAGAGVKRLVFASSCSVYGHGESESLTETSPLNPVSLYAKCKAEAETALLAISEQTGLCVTALRFATLFGISGRTRFDIAINVMTKNAYVARKITVEGGGRQWRPFLHVADAARSIIRALESAPDRVNRRVYNVGKDTNNLRILNLAFRIRDLVPGTEIVMAPTDPDLRDYNVAFNRIREELEFEPSMSIDDGIREVYEALRDGRVDPDDRRGYTLRQYMFLVEVERTYRQMALDGQILTQGEPT